MSQNKTRKLNPLKEKIEIQKNAKTIPQHKQYKNTQKNIQVI